MELLAWLITGHLVGDFLLQTAWMATNKASKPAVLVLHSCVYTAAVFLFSIPAGGLNIYAVLLILISHIFLDRRSFVLWWCRHITKSAAVPWLVIVTDQTMHAIFLAAACLLKRGWI